MFQFRDEPTPAQLGQVKTDLDSDLESVSTGPPPWVVLSVEDDPDYQGALVDGLSDFQIDGRSIQVLTAQSAKDATRILAHHKDIALILLDVIMETDDAGMRLVKTIRDVMGNASVRIVMLTGQPGVAPRMDSVLNLDINEYWHKPDLTVEKLRAVTVSNVRSWKTLDDLEKARNGLQLLVDASADWNTHSDLGGFANSVLASIGRLMGSEEGGLVCLKQGQAGAPFRVVASSGRFAGARDRHLHEFLSGQALSNLPEVGGLVERALTTGEHQFGKQVAVLMFPTLDSQQAGLVITDIRHHLDDYFVNILKLFLESAATGLKSLLLQNRLANLAYEEQILKIPNINWLERQLANIDSLYRSRLDLLVFTVEDYPKLKLSLGTQCGVGALQQLYKVLSERFDKHRACCSLGGSTIGLMLEKGEVPSLEQLQSFEHFDVAVEGTAFSVSVNIFRIELDSLGVEEPEDIIHQVRFALHHAEKNRLHLGCFDPKHIRESIENFELLRQLHQALEADEQLQLYFQPKVDIHSCEVVGAEALIRWQHPDRGLVPPVDFIPLAEQSGLIESVDRKVLALLADAQSVLNNAGHNVALSFNTTVRDLSDDRYLRAIRDMVSSDSVDVSKLEIEITETMAMENYDDVNPVLEELTRSGFRVAIDDFGTGYSSLAHIVNLHASCLKIDRSLVESMMKTAEGEEIIAMIISLASRLKYDVIAEGVETEAQHNLLSDRGCRFGQGYYYGRPMPLHDFLEFIGGANG